MKKDFFSPCVSPERMHPNFIRVLEPDYENARNLFNQWSDGFLDRDNKIVTEFQTTFNSTFWEVYLHAVFKEYGFKTDFSYSSPDFLISNGCDSVIVEATICNASSGNIPEWEKVIIDQGGNICIPKRFDKINREAMVRICNSLKAKEKNMWIAIPNLRM